MDAKELRIGNYVYMQWGKLLKQQQGERSEIYQIQNVNLQNAKKYDPIPLTEEWLLKFGFTVRYFNEDKAKPLWWKVEGNRHVDIYFEKQVSAYVFMINSLQYSIPLLNIHQIQNLYFALTGQELTIKQ